MYDWKHIIEFCFKFWKKRLLTDLDGLGDLDRDLDLALAVKLLL